MTAQCRSCGVDGRRKTECPTRRARGVDNGEPHVIFQWWNEETRRDCAGFLALAPFNGPVDGGSTDGEKLGYFGQGMFAGVVQFNEEGFLR